MRPYVTACMAVTMGWALACGGSAPEPLPLPAGLECLADLSSRPAGKIEEVHDAAAHSHELRTKAKKTQKEMCDPTTDRMRTGYVVHAYAMQVSRDDLADAVVILEWNARTLGNPQSAVKLGDVFIQGAPDGRPAQDVVKGAGFDAGANAVIEQVLAAEGRGRALEMTHIPHTRNLERLRPHAEALQMQRPNVALIEAEVRMAFEASLN